MVSVFAAAALLGIPQQGPPASSSASGNNLDDLRRTAERTAAEWASLNRQLEPNLARLLPCDTRIKNYLNGVSRASEARLQAWTRYLQAWLARSRQEADQTRQLLADRQARLVELEAEGSEAGRYITALESQRDALAQNASGLPALKDALQALDQAIEIDRRWAAALSDQHSHLDALEPALKEAAAVFSRRVQALEHELALAQAETVKWRAYYQARLARAQTECAITAPADDDFGSSASLRPGVERGQ